jgi:anti-anti-sigma factor
MLESSIKIRGEDAVIHLSGRLDSTTARDFQSRVDEALSKSPKRVVLEMGRVGFMSSAALRVIIMLLKQGKAAGVDILAAQASDEILEIFRISGFQKMIRTVATVDEALQ